MAERDGGGRWVAGVSGNPGGRPVMPVAVRADVESGAAEAVAMLRDVVAGRMASSLSRVRAAEVLILRAYGRPAAEVLGGGGTIEGSARPVGEVDGESVLDALREAVERVRDLAEVDGSGAVMLRSGLVVPFRLWTALADRVAELLGDELPGLVERVAGELVGRAEMPIGAAIGAGLDEFGRRSDPGPYPALTSPPDPPPPPDADHPLGVPDPRQMPPAYRQQPPGPVVELAPGPTRPRIHVDLSR